MAAMQHRFWWAILSILSIATTLHAAPPIDCSDTLATIAKKHTLMPGMVAAIVDDDRVTAIGSVGVRKAGSPETFMVDDAVHLGSCTKAMTAVLVGQFVSAKKLSFDETVADIFPELQRKMHPAVAKITVEQLLQHVAGLPANLNWWEFNRPGVSLVDKRRQVVERLLSQAPESPPGAKYVYSNAGYVVLGAVLEKVSGQSWETLIQKKLFDPLGMTTAGFGIPGTSGKLDAPWGHSFTGDVFAPDQTDNPPVMGPAGRVHCSISDWARFVSLFLSNKHADVVSEEMIQQLTMPGKVGEYMGGWIMTRRAWGDGIVLNHSGSNTTWFCVAWVSPRKHFATLVATNYYSPDAEKACDEVSGELIRLRMRMTNVQAPNPNQ